MELCSLGSSCCSGTSPCRGSCSSRSASQSMKRRSKIFRLRPRSTGFFHSLLPQLFDFPLPSPLKVFEMLVVPEQEYPLVCVAISQGSDPSQVVRFETINLNSCSSWFTEIGTSESHRWKMVEVWRTESLEGFFFFFFFR